VKEFGGVLSVYTIKISDNISHVCHKNDEVETIIILLLLRSNA